MQYSNEDIGPLRLEWRGVNRSIGTRDDVQIWKALSVRIGGGFWYTAFGVIFVFGEPYVEI